MKHSIIHSARPLAAAAPSVISLPFHEAGLLDAGPIYTLFEAKGETEAEEIVCRVLEDIAYRLDLIQQARSGHNIAEIEKPARRIVHIAAQVGLVDVDRAAQCLCDAVRACDGIAIEAICARLERAFDFAITEIWRYRERA